MRCRIPPEQASDVETSLVMEVLEYKLAALHEERSHQPGHGGLLVRGKGGALLPLKATDGAAVKITTDA